MGNCVAKPSERKCESDRGIPTESHPVRSQLVASTSSPAGCFHEEHHSDSSYHQCNGSNNQQQPFDQIDQIALKFVTKSSSDGTHHSYPNTPVNSSNNLVGIQGGTTSSNGMINGSISTPSQTPNINEDEHQLTLRSFSNSSTPKIIDLHHNSLQLHHSTNSQRNNHIPKSSTLTYNSSARHSITEFNNNNNNSINNSDHNINSIKKFSRPLSIAENTNCIAALPVNNPTTNVSTYLTSVTGPEAHKEMLKEQLSDKDSLIALFDYNARDQEEISLRKGDILTLLDESDDEWLFVSNKGKKGLVPKSYTAKKDSVESEDWFFYSISRKDAERLLLLRDNVEGTFLVRGSETETNNFSLSVLHQSAVNHYRLKRKRRSPNDSIHHTTTTSTTTNNSNHNLELPQNDEVFCITSRVLFDSIQDLVYYYRADANGLCCKLTRACPRPPPVTVDLTKRTRDRWEISRKSIELLVKLGSGNFGDVFQGKWNGTTDVAVKTLKPGTMAKEEFLKEARIMKKLNHPNLVRLYAVCSDDPIYIVTELMSKGSLLDYLRSDEGAKTPLPHQLDMMAQIANGMSYLEKEGYIHRDLASRNILIDDCCVCKIADFGLTRIVHGSGDIYNAKQGAKFPIKWTAPEAALIGVFTVKSDVWSYGIVLYEIITHGQTPYPAMNNTQTLQQVERGYRMAQPPKCPNEIYEIMLTCWDSVPEKRPSFGTLAEFFNDLPDDCKYRPQQSPRNMNNSNIPNQQSSIRVCNNC